MSSKTYVYAFKIRMDWEYVCMLKCKAYTKEGSDTSLGFIIEKYGSDLNAGNMKVTINAMEKYSISSEDKNRIATYQISKGINQ